MPESQSPLPAFTSWPTFPFEGDLRVKTLEDPVAAEPPRHGEDPSECTACRAPDEAYIWVSERWRVRALDRPTGLPMVLILESRSHLDLGDLPNLLAAELGVMTVRLERAIRSLDGVARVHVNRWGDGSAHLHVWFLARPKGRLQLRGTFLSLWDDILPRIPEHDWKENLALVAAWLAEFGGRPLAEPPRIQWKSPATLSMSEPIQAPEEAEVSAGESVTVAEAPPDTVEGSDDGSAVAGAGGAKSADGPDGGASRSGAAGSGAAGSASAGSASGGADGARAEGSDGADGGEDREEAEGARAGSGSSSGKDASGAKEGSSGVPAQRAAGDEPEKTGRTGPADRAAETPGIPEQERSKRGAVAAGSGSERSTS